MRTIQRTLASSNRIKSMALLIAAVCTLFAMAGTTLAIIMTKTPTLNNLFISGLNPTGDLAVRKVVEHPFGDSYIVPDNDNTSFAFWVDLGEEQAGKTFGDYTADENGMIMLKVKAGETVSVPGIPSGKEVTVTEQDGGAGFAVQDGEKEKTVTIRRGTVSSVCFTNVYTPAPASAALTITGTKELEGREWQEGDSFTFRLEQYANGTWESLGDRMITCSYIDEEDDSGQSIRVPDPESLAFDFSDLMENVSFDAAGMYPFRVTEVEGNVGGITYDEAESHFDVCVGDADMDGMLEIQGISSVSENTQIDGTHVSMKFINHYAPSGSAEAVIKIEKKLEDASGQNRTPEGFSFGLYDESGVLVADSEPTSSAGETTIRMVFPPSDAGKTFAYTLKEICGDAEGMQYDRTEVQVYVSVVDNLDGTVSACIYDDQNLISAFDVPVPEEEQERPDPEESESEEDSDASDAETLKETDAQKEEESKEEALEEPEEADVQENEKAEEQETEETDAQEIEEVNVQENEEANVQENGEVNVQENEEANEQESEEPKDIGDDVTEETSEAEYEEPEEGSLMEPEESDGQEEEASDGQEVEADEAEPEEPELPEGGTLESDDSEIAAFFLENEEDDNESDGPDAQSESAGMKLRSRMEEMDVSNCYTAEFTNVYDPENADMSISGQKELSGRELKTGEFCFHLYETGADFAVSENSEPLDTAFNAADGSFTFRTLNFASVGTYYYAVTEDDSNPLGGITYDDRKYTVEIQVTDDGGHLRADAVIADESGRKGSIVFYNSYQAGSTSVLLSGRKNLTGRSLKEDEFTFDLYRAADDLSAGGAAIQSVKNKADGSFAFSELTFSEKGTWRYIVKENGSSAAAGMAYDESEYLVTVSVTDDDAGNLVPSVETVKKTGQTQKKAQEIRFENRYSANYATLSLGGEKVLHGATLRKGMFTFRLYQADAAFNPTGSAVRSAVNDSDGNFVFDALTYENAGTYYYVMTEDDSKALAHITYDDTSYGIKVMVSDGGNGQLTASSELTELGKGKVSRAVFENTYTAEESTDSVKINIEKEVKNTGSESIGPEGFTFVLENTDTGEEASVKSDEDGLADFRLIFTEEDAGHTYHYKLYEKEQGKKGVTYSDAVYRLKIVVSESEDGSIDAELYSDGKLSTEFKASFVNTYDSGSNVITVSPGSGEITDESHAVEGTRTGDDSHPILWLVLALISAGALTVGVMAVKTKKKRNKEKN